MPRLEVNFDESEWDKLELFAKDRAQTPEGVVKGAVHDLLVVPPVRWQGQELLVIFHELVMRVGSEKQVIEIEEMWRKRHPAVGIEEVGKGIAQLELAGYIGTGTYQRGTVRVSKSVRGRVVGG